MPSGPGKPLAFATRGATLVFGLPGNPVSALVAVELFVRPALRALQGDASPGPSYATARLAPPVRRNAVRDELVRARTVREGDETVLEPVSGQESHMIARAAGADALVLVLAGEGELAAGELARYLLWLARHPPTLRPLSLLLSCEKTEHRTARGGRRRAHWSRAHTDLR